MSHLIIPLFIICGWFGRCPLPEAPPAVIETAPIAAVTAAPTETAETPDAINSLIPWSFPWSPAGMNDSGYCPLVDGWGWTGSLLWPVEGYTEVRPFGWLGPGRGFHSGIDLTVPIGTAVIAPTAGAVVWRGYTSAGYGVMFGIASSGYTVILAHLSAVVEGLECGDAVTAGQVVGFSGKSGAASWPHVHLEVRWNGLAWNPGVWLPG